MALRKPVVPEKPSPPITEPDQNVYVVMYDHKHGIDLYIHKTRAGAKESALCLVLEERESMDPNTATDEEMLAKWFEVTGGNENITINEAPLGD